MGLSTHTMIETPTLPQRPAYQGFNGPLLGTQLKQDPRTGYLEALRADAITVQNKINIITKIKDGLTACQAIAEEGINEGDWYRHMAVDARLRADAEHVKRAHAYRVEEVLAQRAMDPKASFDRLVYLRAWLPERYNPSRQNESKVTIEINVGALDRAEQRAGGVDTTAVPASETP